MGSGWSLAAIPPPRVAVKKPVSWWYLVVEKIRNVFYYELSREKKQIRRGRARMNREWMVTKARIEMWKKHRLAKLIQMKYNSGLNMTDRAMKKLLRKTHASSTWPLTDSLGVWKRRDSCVAYQSRTRYCDRNDNTWDQGKGGDKLGIGSGQWYKIKGKKRR